MSDYPTIEEDLQRARDILDKGFLVGADHAAVYELLESFVAEIARLQTDATRAALHYTVKGYDAGENSDSKAWRQRAETAEAEVARLQSMVRRMRR